MFRTKKALVLFSIPLLFSTVKAFTLDETALVILKGGADFQGEVLSLEALAQNMKTDSNLPDPQLGGEYLVAAGDEPNRWGMDLTWNVEWPGVYNARGKEAEAKLEVRKQFITVDRKNRLADIKKLLLDYVLQEKTLQLIDGLAKNAETMIEVAQTSVKSGEITRLELDKLGLEKALLNASRVSLIDERSVTETQLAELFGADCSPLLKQMICEFPTVTLPTREEIECISASSPEVLAAMAQTEAARRARKVASMEALPNLSVGYLHEFEDGMHFNGASLGISVPIFSSRNKQKAAKADIAEAVFKAESEQAKATIQIEQYLKRISQLRSQIAETAPFLENEDHAALLQKAYENNLITMIDYLTEINYFTKARIELLALRHAESTAMAELERYIATKSEY